MDPDAVVVAVDVVTEADVTWIVAVPPDKGTVKRNTDTEEETGVSKERKLKARLLLRNPLKAKLKPLPLLRLLPLRSP